MQVTSIQSLAHSVGPKGIRSDFRTEAEGREFKVTVLYSNYWGMDVEALKGYVASDFNVILNVIKLAFQRYEKFSNTKKAGTLTYEAIFSEYPRCRIFSKEI